MTDPLRFVSTAALGTRVVVRSRIPGGQPGALLTDALGFLREVGPEVCVVETRDGDKTIALANIVAAKEVPPAPPLRGPRL